MKPSTTVRFVVLLLITSGCFRSSDHSVSDEWSSFTPYTIPYRVRVNQLEKSNLVNNPSFEEGRYFDFDTTGKAFEVKGWKKVGNGIEWVSSDKKNLYSPDETHSGDHAIKLVSEQTNETGQSKHGIVSDFIKVIPGHYELSLYLRMENIASYLAHTGAPLCESIDIRLVCYSKTKNEITNHLLDPFTGAIIDQSFQARNLSLFNYMYGCDWMKILCRSTNNIYLQGVIPSNSRYVRVQVLLRGTGTIWIDDINLRYTEKNFTLEERLQQINKNHPEQLPGLVPLPQKALHGTPVWLDSNIKRTVILVPDYVDSLTFRAAQIIKNRLIGRLSSENLEIVHDKQNITDNTQHLIISIGNTSLLTKYRSLTALDQIVGHSDGYIIYQPKSAPTTLILAGNSPVANYYAAQTLAQLTDTTEGLINVYNIIDYPDIKERAILPANISNARAFDQLVRQAIEYRYNFFYANPASYTAENLLQFEAVRRKNADYGNFGLTIYEPEFYNVSKSVTLETLMPWDKLLIRSEEEFPISCKPSDPKEISFKTRNFNLFLSYILNRIHPQSHKLELLPPFSNCESIALSYGFGSRNFANENFTDLTLLWSGPSTSGTLVDGYDLLYMQTSTPANLTYFDNSFSGNKYFPQNESVTLLNYLLSGVVPHNFTTSETARQSFQEKYIVNAMAGSLTEQLKLLAFSDFCWNMDQYDPVRSYYNILVLKYGKTVALETIRFIDNMQQYLYNIESGRYEKSRSRLLKKPERYLADLERIVTLIENQPDRPDALVVDLKELLGRLKNLPVK